MDSLRSLLDGVGFPSGTSSDCVSCFPSRGRKSPTSGFSWTGWVIHFVLHCPFLRLQLGSLNRKLSQTDWTLGKPFSDPENALHTVFVSLPGAQTSWAPSPLPGRPPTAWHQQCFLACLGCLKSLGLKRETGLGETRVRFSFLSDRRNLLLDTTLLCTSFVYSPFCQSPLDCSGCCSHWSRCFLPRPCSVRTDESRRYWV